MHGVAYMHIMLSRFVHSGPECDIQFITCSYSTIIFYSKYTAYITRRMYVLCEYIKANVLTWHFTGLWVAYIGSIQPGSAYNKQTLVRSIKEIFYDPEPIFRYAVCRAVTYFFFLDRFFRLVYIPFSNSFSIA